MDSDLQEEVTSASVENEAKAGDVTVELEVNVTDVDVEEMAQDDDTNTLHKYITGGCVSRDRGWEQYECEGGPGTGRWNGSGWYEYETEGYV